MKRGFFFLRPCDHPARQQCSMCGRSFCEEHLRIRPGSNAPACLDCLGRAQQKRSLTESGDDLEPAWCYGYRQTYYADGYQPWYFGRRPGNNNKEDYDVRVFDSEVDDDLDGGPDGDADTFDS